MTERERFIKALKREPVEGLVPTFELVFYLTMEAFGKVHSTHRYFSQWNQMSDKERDLQITDVAQLHVDVAKKYNHSAIFVHPTIGEYEWVKRLLTRIRELSGDEYFLGMHGDPTYAIPNGEDMMDFSVRLYEEPDKILSEQRLAMDNMTKFAEDINHDEHLLDGFFMCSDYCFNTNPFYSPDVFADLIAPVLAEQIRRYRDLGMYSIKHTDGNIMPILDQLVQCKPDALHSIDPQANVDLGIVNDLVGDKVALCGNVNCGLLQTGTDEQIIEDVKRSLRDGMKRGKGYIFCTSNCVYTGMDLRCYELMLEVWKQYGRY